MSADASRLRQSLEQWATQVVAFAGPETARLAQADSRVPRGESGKLVESIRSTYDVKITGSGRSTSVVAPVIQAATTEKGARPHLIEGRPLLAFYWPKAGQVVVFPRVNHPGNPPRPWWEAVVTDAWKTALRTAARSTSL